MVFFRNTFKEQILIVIGLVGLITMNFVTLHEIYLKEKRVFTEEMNATLASLFLNWESETYLKDSGYGSSIDDKGNVYIQTDKTYIFQVPQEEWSSEINRIRNGYDICDSTKWTSAILDSLFTAVMQERYGFSVSHVFALTDSSGMLINRREVGAILPLMRIKGNDIPLGFIHPRIFYSEFSIPFSLIWERSWSRLLSVCFLFIVLFGCIQMLYKYLKNEKKTAEYRDQFVSALVHNLRRPVITARNVLSADSYESGEKISNTQGILSEMVKTIDHLLSLSVNETGLQLHCESCALKPFIQRHVKKFLTNSSKNKEVRIHIQIIPEEMNVWIDPFHFGGVVDNLIDNAVKYSGEKVDIVITGRREKTKWILSVKDNGIGISPKAQRRIFNRYHREVQDKIRIKQKGYGIGLSYVWTVVKAHKGNIQVVSDGEHGTDFVIELFQNAE